MTSVSTDIASNYDAYYDDDVSEWRALGAREKARNIRMLCTDVPHRTIADVGAGEGSVASRLADFGDITCFEISDSGVSKIQARGLIVEKFDGYTIPCQDKAFELAYASHVLEHVEHERLFLYELGRIAEYIYIEVPLEHTIRMSADFTWNRVGHINFYCIKTVRRLIQSCGFEILRQKSFQPLYEIYRYKYGTWAPLKYAARSALRIFGSSIVVNHFGILARQTSQHPAHN